MSQCKNVEKYVARAKEGGATRKNALTPSLNSAQIVLRILSKPPFFLKENNKLSIAARCAADIGSSSVLNFLFWSDSTSNAGLLTAVESPSAMFSGPAMMMAD